MTWAAPLSLALACTDTQAPDTQAPVDPNYAGGELEPGEFEPPDPHAAGVVRGDPPMRVGAVWSAPNGEPAPPRVSAIVLDVGVAEICGVAQTQVYFDYDSATLDPETEAMIAALARCFATGPLKDRSLEVVGHADPRGDDIYNNELGESRAESVAQVLLRNGLPGERLSVRSSGEALAHSDAARWPEDRRVDIIVVSR